MDKDLKQLLESQASNEWAIKNEPGLVALINECLEKDCVDDRLLPMMQEGFKKSKKALDELEGK